MATHDLRVVNYGYIHDHKPEYFTAFIDTIDISDGLHILDPFCGYGEVTEKIIERANHLGVRCTYALSDCSQTQIDRARTAFADTTESIDIILADAAQLPYADNSFDRVVIKMGLHETPEITQRAIMAEVYRVLKPGGKFITWEIGMDTSEQLEIFAKVIQAKNRIAGFYDINRSRYFQTEQSLLELISNCGLTDVKKVYDIYYSMNTFHRKGELVSVERVLLERVKQTLDKFDENFLERLSSYRLKEFEKCIQEIISLEKREMMNYSEDINGSISIDAHKVIVVANKI
jgi:ubiquinone/menaquinone biosynthesis C-methylase UbiE